MGLAISDPEKIIAYPFKTIDNDDIDSLLSRIGEIIAEKGVDLIVLGLPLNLKGEDSKMTVEVREFRNELNKKFPKIPIHFIDERFTSKQAQDIMREVGEQPSRDKKTVDAISATLLLEVFIEKLDNNSGDEFE